MPCIGSWVKGCITQCVVLMRLEGLGGRGAVARVLHVCVMLCQLWMRAGTSSDMLPTALGGGSLEYGDTSRYCSPGEGVARGEMLSPSEAWLCRAPPRNPVASSRPEWECDLVTVPPSTLAQ